MCIRDRPYTPGFDGAGVVDKVGEGVQGLSLIHILIPEVLFGTADAAVARLDGIGNPVVPPGDGARIVRCV